MIWSLAWRNVRSHKPRAALNLIGIALAIGLIFAVLSLSKTLVTSFDDLYGSVYGNVNLVVSGSNGQGTVRSSVENKIRKTSGVKVVVGQIQSVLPLVKKGKAGTSLTDQLTTVGISPAAPDLTGAKLVSGHRIRGGHDITINSDFASSHHLSVGQWVKLASSGVYSFKIVGLMRFGSGEQFGGGGYAYIPITRARQVFGPQSGFNEIDIQTSSSVGVDAVQKSLRAKLAKNLEVALPSQRSSNVDTQLKAFNAILDFFGTMAAFVGAFLVLNSFNMSVAQRLREIGMLRTIGTSRRQITRSILLEALLLSVLGAPVGLAVGFLLAHLMGLLVQSVDYPIGTLRFPLAAFVLAPLAGIAATVLGALRPAIAAGRVPPIRAVLAEHATAPLSIRPRIVGGILTIALGLVGVYKFAAATTLPVEVVVLGVAGITLLFGGVVAIAPVIVPSIVRVLSRPIRLVTPIEGRMASDSTRANPRRTAATASGLMIGVALVVTIGSLGASLIGSISDDLNKQVLTDFTVQPANFRQGGTGTKSPMATSVQKRIKSQAGVKVATGVGLLLVPNGYASGDYQALGYDPATRSQVTTVPFARQSAKTVYAKVARGEVTIGGQLWRRAHVVAGDRINLKGPGQNMRVTVAGVISGTSLEDLQVGMSQSTFTKLTGVHGYSQIDVVARSRSSRAKVNKELQSLVNHSYPDLTVLSNQGIKNQVESQTNQVFAIFYAIMLVAVLVSLLGVVNTMMISVLERTREIGVLRSIGTTRWGIGRMVTDESVLLTVAGALIGLLVGIAIGYAYVKGVSSGLSGISFRPPVGVSIAVAVASVLAGLVAALVPARHAAKMNIIEAISYE